MVNKGTDNADKGTDNGVQGADNSDKGTENGAKTTDNAATGLWQDLIVLHTASVIARLDDCDRFVRLGALKLLLRLGAMQLAGWFRDGPDPWSTPGVPWSTPIVP